MWTLAWWWMLAALPAPWLVRRFLRSEILDRSAALKVPAGSPFADLAGAMGGAASAFWRLALMWIVWTLAVLAAARPQFVGEPVALPRSGRDLLMVIDLSGSMEEQDFQLNGQWVDRLTATKAVAKDFIANRVGDRLGLILFGREVYLQTPLTFDRATVQTLLDESAIGLAGKETAIGDAIGLAIRTLEDASVEEGRRVVILLTDGEHNQATTRSAFSPRQTAQLAASLGIPIYAIDAGSDLLAEVDPDAALARKYAVKTLQ